MRPAVVSVVGIALAACASTPQSHRASAPASSPPPIAWLSPGERDHPLVGRVWDVAHARFVEADERDRALREARYVLLGEVHDNPDAHRLQADTVRMLLEGRRHTAVVFEMFDADRQETIDRSVATAPRDADALGTALDMAHSGWDWAFYRPIVEVALRAGAPIVAGNFPHAAARSLVLEGLGSIPADTVAQLGLTEPMAPAVHESLRREMRESHCNMLPEEMLDGMVLAQRARDGEMARRMEASADGAGAVLICGAGHARNDRGVPVRLHHDEPSATVVSVGFVEVAPDRRDPSAYAANYESATLPFDYAWFIPVAQRDPDPCAALRAHAAPSR